MDDPERPTEVEPRPFADFLLTQAKGTTHRALSEQLQKLTLAVADTRKAGTLTLTVTISPLEDNLDALVVTDKVAVKVPEHSRPSSIFFSDHAGNLTRDDPNNVPLFPPDTDLYRKGRS